MPSVTHWSRIEPRPRDAEISDSLCAEVRDPLWILGRQAQIGEFNGKDAGSAVAVRAELEHRDLTHYRLGDGPPTLLGDTPLEAAVEREAPPTDLRARAQAGLQWARLLEREGAGPALGAFVLAFPLDTPDPAESAARRLLATLGERVADGIALLDSIARGEDPADPRLPDGAPLPPEHAIAPPDRERVRRAAATLGDWYVATFGASPTEGSESPAWNPASLSYELTLSAGDPREGGTAFEAREHRGGDLDWHAFDRGGTLTEHRWQTETVRTLPIEATFPGMPASRWWQFEDAAIDFGSIAAGPADVARMLAAQFALIHGDDWLRLPYRAPVGSLLRVRSVVITDSFGQHFLLPEAGRRQGHSWERWQVFALSSDENEEAGPFLLLPPTLAHLEESPPVEEVGLLRDEMTNMAWGVERTLPNAGGEPVAGHDPALARSRGEPEEAHVVLDRDGLSYRLATPVTANWIPLVPVSAERNRICFERASMLGQAGRAIEPRGRILRPQETPYRIDDEQIPAEARAVRRRFQWGRWADGSTHLWVGRAVRTAIEKDEGGSGLRFDVLEEGPGD